MTLHQPTKSRPTLGPWVLIVVSLLCGGCHSVTEQRIQHLVQPRVCPACNAISIDECRCFSAAENAGYCETTWAPLVPLMSSAGVVPMDTDYMEELPTPEVSLPPQAKHGGSRRDAQVQTPPAVQTATYRELTPHSAPLKSRQPITSRVGDEARVIRDNFRL